LRFASRSWKVDTAEHNMEGVLPEEERILLETFLKSRVGQLFRSIKSEAMPHFGKMKPQQMMEHLVESIGHSYGHNPPTLQTPVEKLPGFLQFLRSEKQFKPNTPNALLPAEPAPVYLLNLEEALDQLDLSLYRFFDRFSGRETETEVHAFFGPLHYHDWLRMHTKHLTHHLRQFGIEEGPNGFQHTSG
jgi:hypothetical protein